MSRTGVTGARQQLASDAKKLVGRLRRVTNLPIAVGARSASRVGGLYSLSERSRDCRRVFSGSAADLQQPWDRLRSRRSPAPGADGEPRSLTDPDHDSGRLDLLARRRDRRPGRRSLASFFDSSWGRTSGHGSSIASTVGRCVRYCSPSSLRWRSIWHTRRTSPLAHQRIRIGARRDGTLTAISVESHGTAGVGLNAGIGDFAQSLYDCPNFASAQYDVFTNAGPGAAMRNNPRQANALPGPAPSNSSTSRSPRRQNSIPLSSSQ